MKNIEGVDELLSRTVEAIYPSKELLKEALLSGRHLKIYYGIDPTGPHLHLGHLCQLLFLSELQEMGHEIIVLVGDFTAQIGDPTDKLSPRQPLTKQQIKENLKTFQAQAARILRFSGRNAAKIKFNSAWLGKMSFADVVRLAMHVTVQQMLERDMFQERLKAGKPIGAHEFLYPLMQGYDSVAMEVDMEIGGNDQTFNMLMGRTLEKAYKGKEKFVIATRLLVHPQTGKKMSKTEGGTINFDDSPEDIFGKVMALDDSAMFMIAELSTRMPLERVGALKKAVGEGLNPRDAKAEIAFNIVKVICGEKSAQKASESFDKLFSKKETTGDMPTLKLRSSKTLSVLELVIKSGVMQSRSEARRLIEQGGVEIDGAQKKLHSETIALSDGTVVKIGKRNFFRIHG